MTPSFKVSSPRPLRILKMRHSRDSWQLLPSLHFIGSDTWFHMGPRTIAFDFNPPKKGWMMDVWGEDCEEFPEKLRWGELSNICRALRFRKAQDGTLGAKANVATVSSAIDTCERRGSAVCFLWCHPCNHMSDLQCHVCFPKGHSSNYRELWYLHPQPRWSEAGFWVRFSAWKPGKWSWELGWYFIRCSCGTLIQNMSSLRVFVSFVQVHCFFVLFFWADVTWLLLCCERSCELFPWT